MQQAQRSGSRKERTTPFGINLMRSPELFRAAQVEAPECGSTWKIMHNSGDNFTQLEQTAQETQDLPCAA